MPEYCFENKIDVIKPKDKALIIEYLEKKEEEEKRIASEAEANAAANAAAGKKADPKKDAKGKAPAKGAAPVEDKNAPANITVEYQEIDSQDNYIIFERKYNLNQEKLKEQKKKGAPPASAGVLAGGKTNSWGNLDVNDRTKELIN